MFKTVFNTPLHLHDPLIDWSVIYTIVPWDDKLCLETCGRRVFTPMTDTIALSWYSEYLTGRIRFRGIVWPSEEYCNLNVITLILEP